MSLYASLKKDLKTIDKALLNLVESEESPIIEQAANQLLAAGGKRIRPIFVLLCARLGKINQAAAMKLAVAIELIHSASILHDDVVDDSDMRRGKISVKAKWIIISPCMQAIISLLKVWKVLLKWVTRKFIRF